MLTLSKGDIISVRTHPEGGSRVTGDLPLWANSERFTADNVGAKGTPGKAFIRIRSVDHNTADGYGVSMKTRRLKPEDQLEFTVQNRGLNHLPSRFPWLNNINIPGASPGETLLIRIAKINGMTATAIIEKRIDTLEVGGTIEARVNYNSKIATCDEKEVDIRLDEPAKITSEATIQIDTLESDIAGHVRSYNSEVPKVGCLLIAKIKRSSQPQRAIADNIDCQIQISEPTRATGKAVIRVTEAGDPLTGTIESYQHLLPECGDVVELYARRGSRTAEHLQQEYTVRLNQESLVEGTVYVNITSIGDEIGGEIESYGSSLPKEGEQVTTTVSAGASRTESSDGTFTISLLDTALISSTITVEITEISDMVYGVITDYYGTVPDVGDVIKLDIHQTANGLVGVPHNKAYSVKITNEESYTGLALVKITEQGTPMVGILIESREADRQNPNRNRRSSPFQNNKNNNKLLSRNKL